MDHTTFNENEVNKDDRISLKEEESRSSGSDKDMVSSKGREEAEESMEEEVEDAEEEKVKDK